MWPLILIAGAAALYDNHEQEQARNRAVHLFGTYVDRTSWLLGHDATNVQRADRQHNAAGRPHGIEVNGRWLKGRLDLLARQPGCLPAALTWLAGHELCHVVGVDELWRTPANAPLQEQSADEWGGIAVARAGLPRQSLRCALLLIGDSCSVSHGCGVDRVARSVGAYDAEIRRLRPPYGLA